MDFFNKFIRIPSAPKQVTTSEDAQVAFAEAWETTRSTLENLDERTLLRGIKITNVPAKLQVMSDMLIFESNRVDESTTGACLEYLLKNDVLSMLEKLSETDRPSGIKAEVLKLFNSLVVSLDEKFLIHRAVHVPLTRLLRSCVGEESEDRIDGDAKPIGAAAIQRGLPSDYEQELVDLMCIICSKIRTFPILLMIFFHDKTLQPRPNFTASPSVVSTPPKDSARAISPEPSSVASTKREFEFILFNYLLRFVHREGRIGDFSRAGLLFLVDLAFSTGEETGEEEQEDPMADSKLLLAEYMSEGDTPDVLGAGLSAVYSNLPQKVVIKAETAGEATSGGMRLGGLSIEEPTDSPPPSPGFFSTEADVSTNPEFKERLNAFFKIFEFFQDILKRISSALPTISSSPLPVSLQPKTLVAATFTRAILTSIKSVFLEHVLYPSILECSDQDGSAVAVISYVDLMLGGIDPLSPLAQLLISFLIGDDSRGPLELKAFTFGVGTSFLGLSSLNRKGLSGGPTPPPAATKEIKVNRRKSTALMLLENQQPKSRSQYFTSTGGRFTLKDLLSDHLISKDPPTAAAAMKLFQTIICNYSDFALADLLSTLPDSRAVAHFTLPKYLVKEEGRQSRPGSPDSDVFVYPGAEETMKDEPVEEPPWTLPPPTSTIGTHVTVMGLYLSLLSDIDPTNDPELVFAGSYSHYIHDAQIALNNFHSPKLRPPELSNPNGGADSIAASRRVINPADSLIRILVESLKLFFSHGPQENLRLTGVLATLALCENLSLDGWLAFAAPEVDPWAERDPLVAGNDENDADDDRSVDFDMEKKLATTNPILDPFSSSYDNAFKSEKSQPVLYVILKNLVRKLESYRLIVPEFDQYLTERRQGLHFEEHMSDALLLAMDSAPENTDTLVAAYAESSSTSPFTRTSPSSKFSSVTSTPVKTAKQSRIAALFSPVRSKPAPSPSTPINPSKPPYVPRGGYSASPYQSHYDATNTLKVEGFQAQSPKVGVWSPALKDQPRFSGRSMGDISEYGDDDEVDEEEEDDVMEVRRNGGGKLTAAQELGEKKVTLSQVLDNVVILEECIKELTAILIVRSSFGIDALGAI